MTAYEFKYSVDTGVLLPSLGAAIEEINGHMRDFGFNTPLECRSQVVSVSLLHVRDMYPEELLKMARDIEGELQKKLPRYKIRYECFRKVE